MRSKLGTQAGPHPRFGPTERDSMTKTVKAAAMSAVAALLLAACGGSSGGGGNVLIISSDLPLQGSNKDANDMTNNAIKLYLEQIGNTVTADDGTEYTLEFKIYDNSTAAKGAWDDAQCAKNAQDHVANVGEIAVMGTYNSGCAKIIVPILNQDPDGPMLMVSNANTNPGLTKTWDPGEPEKYYPTGVRNYGRVISTDDFQGAAGAQFFKQDIGVKKCYVINDNSTYGQGVARAFEAEAKKQGIEVAGFEAYDPKQPNYTSLFNKIKATGIDCLYVGATFDMNGGQLVKDKVGVLGDNTKVKMLLPDGFVGYPEYTALPESEGSYLSFSGLSADALIAAGGQPAEFATAFEEKYGMPLTNSYSIYGVAAVQAIIEAIKKSDGTRAGVSAAFFGVTVGADVSMLGKEIKFDANGDVAAIDMTILQAQGGKEVTLKPWSVQS